MKSETKQKGVFWNKFKNKLKYFYEEFIKFPAYLISHPLKGFYEFKRYKRAKTSVAVTFIIVLIFLSILSFQYTGFELNFNRLSDLNTFAEIIYIIAPILLITVANWSVTTLFDGKGTMKEIFLMVSYSIFPLIWSTAIGMVLSNILTGEEIALYYLTLGVGAFLTGYMVFLGLISIHEYGLGKCILTILFTIIAMAIIIFILILAFDLFRKMFGFLYTVYQEITLRDLL